MYTTQYHKYTFIFIFIFCYCFCSHAQNTSDMAMIKNAIQVKQEVTTKNTAKKYSAKHPIKSVSFLLLSLYQKIISEQISAVCEFDMSCSNFGVNAMKEFGVFKAIGLTADRLMRCNGVAHSDTENYLINHDTGKVIDEPSMYRFKH